jgi:transposase-like protein
MTEGVSKLLIWYPLLRTSGTSFVGGTMITQVLHCPYCHGTDIVRHGLSPEGKQRYRCRACLEGRGRAFLLEYRYAGHSPEVKQQIVDMAMNASGIRDTARVLHVSPTTVINELPGCEFSVAQTPLDSAQREGPSIGRERGVEKKARGSAPACGTALRGIALFAGPYAVEALTPCLSVSSTSSRA